MNLIKYIKRTLRTVKFENKISKVIKNVLANKSNDFITHNNGKLVRQKAKWGEIKHNFVPGIYLRQMILNPTAIIISAFHKRDHVWFLLEGDITIVNKNGEENFKAPYVGFSKAGTQRVIRANEYSIFQNVFTHSATALFQLVSLVTSKVKYFADPPFSIIFDSTFNPSVSKMSPKMTCAPSEANN